MAGKRKRKYGARSLTAGVDRYFASISRTVEVKERIETGPKTFEERTVISDAGEPVRCREYLAVPTLWGLCESLGVTPAEWRRLCDPAEHPELQDAVQRAAGLMREWKEQTLLTRKDVRGLIFHMQNRLGGLDALPSAEEPELSLSEKGALLQAEPDEDGD